MLNKAAASVNRTPEVDKSRGLPGSQRVDTHHGQLTVQDLTDSVHHRTGNPTDPTNQGFRVQTFKHPIRNDACHSSHVI